MVIKVLVLGTHQTGSTRLFNLIRLLYENENKNVYSCWDYKNDKDKEIQSLKIEQEKLKKLIEENSNLYETMLDKTTQSLEKIISNTESLSKIQ